MAARGGDGVARPVNREPTARHEPRLESPAFRRVEDVKNPNYGYQLYQAERTQTRAEILAGDARHGRWAAGSRRGHRSPARKGRGRGIMVIIAGRRLAPHDDTRASP